MRVLGIESTGAMLGVALVDGECILAEWLELAPREHARLLLPRIAQLLAAVGSPRGQGVDRVAVSCGPGSFTGIRIGMATARALAWGWGVPVLAVSTLAAIAVDAGDGPRDIVPVIDARRGDVYAARFRSPSSGEILRVQEDRALALDELLGMSRDARLIGPGADLHADAIRQRLGSGALVQLPVPVPRAAAVARLGARLAPDTPFVPGYVRPLPRAKQPPAGGPA